MSKGASHLAPLFSSQGTDQGVGRFKGVYDVILLSQNTNLTTSLKYSALVQHCFDSTSGVIALRMKIIREEII